MINEANNRDSETKTEVFAAYQELLGKLKATKKVTRLDEEKEEIANREKRHVVEVMAQQSPHDVSRLLQELKSLINESLKELEVQLVSEQERLVTLRQAIELSNRELADLYDIRANADSLAALLMAQNEKTAIFEEDMKNKQQQLERELKEHKQAFENEIAQKRRELQQEEQEFIHQRDMTRERERAEYEARLRHLEEKETALDQRARQMQEDFRLSIEQERRRIEQEMHLKFDYELKLSAQAMDSERKEFHQRIAALDAKIAHYESLKYSFNNLLYKVDFDAAE